MPGLAIIISPAGREINKPNVDQMVASMRHEAYYVSGTYCNESLGLYVGWVGHPQSYCSFLPMHSDDGNWLLFFYGEHFTSNRRNATTGGSRDSDGQAVLRLIEAHGIEAIAQLNGLFHGLLVDVRRSEIVVFNDRYGMQRLYYYREDTATFFASEAKALLAVKPRLRKLDPRGLGEFLSCGCVLENRSLFCDVATLPAATVRVFSRGLLESQHRYFEPNQWESQPKLSVSDFYEAIHEALTCAIRRCVNSTLPVGISLTGGFDTRMIMAYLTSDGAPFPSYTFGGMYRECFDVKIARKVAEICGCEHQVFGLDANFLQFFPSLAEKTIFLSDGCLGATNAYELYLNAMARKVAIVRLTGNLGSEVMRGSRAFKAVSTTHGFVHPDFQAHIDAATRNFNTMNVGHPISFSVFKQAPWYYSNRLSVEQSQVIVRTPFMDNDFVGLCYRQPSDLGDRRKFARRLIAEGSPTLAVLPTDTGNCSFLRHAWAQLLFKADYCYKSGMPQWLELMHYVSGPLSPERHLIGRHRFSHFRVWFRNQLAPYVREILLDRRTLARPYFNRDFVERMVHQHIKGERNYTDDIERVLTVELTCRQFLDN